MATALGIILTSISMLALGWLVWTQVQKQESRDEGKSTSQQINKSKARQGAAKPPRL